MRSFTAIAIGALALTFAFGCKKANSVVGTWSISGQPGATMQFKPDGTFEAKASTMGIDIDQPGTYTIDGANVTLNKSRPSAKSSDSRTQAMLDKLKAQAPSNVTEKMTIAWKSENEFSLTDPQVHVAQTFTRQ